MSHQLIAIDVTLLNDLVSTLEATKKELKRANELQAEDRLLTVEEAYTLLRVSRPTFYEYMKRQEIVPSEYGSRVWIPKSQIDAFIDRHKRVY